MTNDELLLDTHIFIWLMNGSPQLSPSARTHIEDVATKMGKLYISAISIWEVGMLASKERIHLKEPLSQWVDRAFKAPCLCLAPLSPDIYLKAVNCLAPFIPTQQIV
jgi:PIN domain nuclease of toxin-antitoxin system